MTMPGAAGEAAPAASAVQTIVAVAALGLVAALAGLGVHHWRQRSRAAACRMTLARYGGAFEVYARDFGVIPYEDAGDEGLGHVVWVRSLSPDAPGAAPLCPSVPADAPNALESYRMNSQLSRPGDSPPRPYRPLTDLPRPRDTVVLFDAQYGGPKLSFKGKLKDVDYRHLGQANLLMADWTVRGMSRTALEEASAWLPPQVIWNPDE